MPIHQSKLELPGNSIYGYEVTMAQNHRQENQRSPSVTFLKTVRPFSALTEDQIIKVSRFLEEKSYPKGTLILKEGTTDIEALHIIQSGGVKLYLKDLENREILKEYRGPGDYFGALGIIMDTRANLCVEAVEDTACILVPKKRFLEFLHTDAQVSVFFLKSFCKRYIHSAHSEIHGKEERAKADNALYLFSQDVGSVMKGTLQTCLPDDTAQAAAQKMAKYRIGSLVVRNKAGKVEGIITDKDLRAKLVSKGLGTDEPVRTIMTSQVRTIPSQEVCFDALFSMLKNRIHHLGVERGGEIVGVITSHDILLLQGASPIFLFREIAAQTRIEGLYPIPKSFSAIVRRLMADGAKASNINRVITVLNDQILDRILSLLIEEIGTPPVAFCWLVMGSEGRKEQTFSTDQDNAIIFEIPDGFAEEKAARAYFLDFAGRAVKHLAACGYALCNGDIMASNPKWNLSLPEWQQLFDHWIYSPDPEELLHSTIFFDFRPAFGKMELAHALRQHLVRRAEREKVFIHHLAKDCLATRPPLSLFKHFVLEKEGKNKGLVDLKGKGLIPFVDFARVMCLDHGMIATNTLERIRSLEENNAIPEDLALKIKAAYETQMELRLSHQLKRIQDGQQPDNYLKPSELSEMDRHSLKDAFLVIGEMQSFLKNRFHLNLG
jgi:CBS domain-containing protein